MLRFGSLTNRLGSGFHRGDDCIPCQIKKQALYPFINPPGSFSYPSPKVSQVSVMFLTVTVCARSLRGAPAFRTVVTSHLWATPTNGHPPPLLLTRTLTTVQPMLPPESHRLPRYDVSTTGHIKDYQMTDLEIANIISSWLHS